MEDWGINPVANMPESTKSVTASLWLERAEKHNPILPTPGSPMAAAVAEEVEEYADRKLADFLATRAAPPAMDREAVEKVEGLNPHVVARIKHVLQTVANYADAERNGGEFADDLRRDIACMNGDVVANDLAQFTAALSTLSADVIRQGEGWKGRTASEQATYDHYMGGSTRGDLHVYVKRGRENIMKPERSFGHAYAAWMAGRHLAERDAAATPASHASDGGKANG